MTIQFQFLTKNVKALLKLTQMIEVSEVSISHTHELVLKLLVI